MPSTRRTQAQRPPRTDEIMELISKAIDSKAGGAWEHLESKLTPMKCTPAVFEDILKRLDTSLIPSTFDSVERWDLKHPDHNRIERGSTALRLLGGIFARRLYENPSKDAIVALIVERLDDICRWTKCCFDWIDRVTEGIEATDGGSTFRGNLIIHCWTLRHLWDVDNLISQCLLSMPIFLNIIFQYWVPGVHGDVIMEADPGRECPILGIMIVVGDHEKGRELLIHGALGRGSAFVNLVVLGFIGRARKIATSASVPGRALVRFNNLIASSQQFAFCAASPATLQLAFTKSGYLTECSLALNAISLAVAKLNNVGVDCVESLLRVTHSFLHYLVLSPSQSVRNCRDVVTGGALEHLARTMTILSSYSDVTVAVESGISSIGILGRHIPYPSVLDRLRDTVTPEEWTEGTLQNREVAPTWRSFIKGLRVVRSVHESARQAHPKPFCDNASCDARARGKQIPKQCGGCKSVAYCSLGCQVQDWEERHRRECTQEKNFRSYRSVEMERYSHTDRNFHASLLAKLYQTRSSVIKRDSARFYPGLQPHQIMPIFAVVPLNIEQAILKPLVPVTEGPYAPPYPQLAEGWWGQTEGVSLGQTWLRPRMSQLVEGYRDGKAGGADIRMVEGVFQLGPKYLVCLTVRLERLELGGYEPTYCVSRFADVLPGAGIRSYP